MQTVPEFMPFPKVPRLNRTITITEKVDGTNGIIYISDDLSTVVAGSRNRWLSPEKGKDNFDFAAWVKQREDMLRELLGSGLHYGEYWGRGIGRNYGMTRRCFALFNTQRWKPEMFDSTADQLGVVPVLYEGPFDQDAIRSVEQELRDLGSVIAPWYPEPEGLMVYHHAARHYFKVTLEKDEEWKGKKRE